jgi:hypothetical protein
MLVSGKPGEVWYAEADTPTGPWVYARRVASHGEYNFYNPVHHAFLDQDGGRRIHFEGTYTVTFAAAKEKTPRYEYNQILYRLDLEDPRLALPVPVYRCDTAEGGVRLGTWPRVVAWKARAEVRGVAFFALSGDAEPGGFRLLPSPAAEGPVAPMTVAAAEYAHADGTRRVVCEGEPVPPGYERTAGVPGRVWRNPQRVLAWDPESESVADAKAEAAATPVGNRR